MNNMETVDRVLNGYRMNIPNNCPEQLSNIVKRCWNEKPENRPSFVNLLKELKVTTADSLEVMGKLLADYSLTSPQPENAISYT